MSLIPAFEIVNQLIIDRVSADLKKADAFARRVPRFDFDLAERRISRFKNPLLSVLGCQPLTVLNLEVSVLSPRMVGQHPCNRVLSLPARSRPLHDLIQSRPPDAARRAHPLWRQHAGVGQAADSMGEGLRSKRHGLARASVFLRHA